MLSGVRISTSNRRCGGRMSIIELARDANDSPLDVVEHMAAGNSWPF
jgi:hypothetical protein